MQWNGLHRRITCCLQGSRSRARRRWAIGCTSMRSFHVEAHELTGTLSKVASTCRWYKSRWSSKGQMVWTSKLDGDGFAIIVSRKRKRARGVSFLQKLFLGARVIRHLSLSRTRLLEHQLSQATLHKPPYTKPLEEHLTRKHTN